MKEMIRRILSAIVAFCFWMVIWVPCGMLMVYDILMDRKELDAMKKFIDWFICKD